MSSPLNPASSAAPSSPLSPTSSIPKNAMQQIQTGPKYQAVRNGGDVSPAPSSQQLLQQPGSQQSSSFRVYSPVSSSAVSSATKISSQKSKNSRDELMGNNELGPYSHLHAGSMGSMGSQTYKGSIDSKSKSINSSTDQKYNIGPVASQYLHRRIEPEPDDYLHEGDDDKHTIRFIFCSARGFVNVFVLGVLIAGLLALFAGYPIISHFTKKPETKQGAFGIGGTNGTGQVPIVNSGLKLIDTATPNSALTFTSPTTDSNYHLVFSDEFEVEGRTFWPGDDPFWTAVDLWYGATGDYEWYTPEQINTTGGHLQITFDNKPMHDLNFRSGMLQSWNKFCFQGGYVEFAAILPGSPNQIGWWPGLWLMGNLARPGYLGTTDGMWPYSYDACDSGILPNQTAPGRPGHSQVVQVTSKGGARVGLNWLSGQRTPACTCNADEHPGPNPNVGRSAPEIDVLEAQVKGSNQGQASQSMQTGPFDLDYDWNQDLATIYNQDTTVFNGYTGGVYQEAASALSNIPDKAYSDLGDTFTKFALEYQPDFAGNGDGFITWYVDGKQTWTVTGKSFPARPAIDISQRLIPVEPMSIIMNLGMSRGFQSDLDFTTLTYPNTLKVDYVRVYQNDNNPKDLVSCDPPEYPTTAYINKYSEVYNNINHTTWPNDKPKNTLQGC